mgnify:CR=1 FL=1
MPETTSKAISFIDGDFLTIPETPIKYRAPESIEDVQSLLRNQVYVSDRALAVPIFLAIKLQRPLFLEGEAGVGKTEIARALASGPVSYTHLTLPTILLV